LPEVVSAYQARTYDGNFIRLLDIAPSVQAEYWIYLENKALNGFLKEFPGKDCHEAQIKYCDAWIANL
jgi:hypothetical protein